MNIYYIISGVLKWKLHCPYDDYSDSRMTTRFVSTIFVTTAVDVELCICILIEEVQSCVM